MKTGREKGEGSARCSEKRGGRQGAVGSRLGVGGGEAYSSVHLRSNR